MVQRPLQLREDQLTIIQQAQEYLRRDPSLLITAPTGAGKTVIFSEMIARVLNRNLRAGVLVHRQELVKQAEKSIRIQAQQDPGVIWQSRREWDRPVTIMAQDTVMNLDLSPLQGLDILFIDEAHHAVAPGWLNTVRRLNPRYLLGFSATPFRQDKEPLVPEPFAHVIRPITPKELIDKGILCPAIIESPIIHDQNGDPQPINRANNIESIYLQAIRYAMGNGRSKILLYVSQTQDHSPTCKSLARTTTTPEGSMGITADAIDQNMDLNATQRKAAINRFRSTPRLRIRPSSTTSPSTEGTDIRNVDCVILGRHTAIREHHHPDDRPRSPPATPQKKDCLVIEYTGRPDMDDIIHYWRLDEPTPEGGGGAKNRKVTPTLEQLSELATKFPRTLSNLDDARIQYPWFRPYGSRPLLALPLWSEQDGAARYITVEPQKSGGWRITRVTLNNTGMTPLTRQQTTLNTSEEAATMVRIALGEKASILQRNAGWRLRTPSPGQIGAYRSLRPQDKSHGKDLSAGEISDVIAQERFQRRVDTKVI